MHMVVISHLLLLAVIASTASGCGPWPTVSVNGACIRNAVTCRVASQVFVCSASVNPTSTTGLPYCNNFNPLTATSLKFAGYAISHLHPDSFKLYTLVNDLHLEDLSYKPSGRVETVTLPYGLRRMTLSGCNLTTFPSELFSKSNTLTWISFVNNRLAHIGAGAFDGFPVLLTLYISSPVEFSLAQGLMDNFPTTTVPEVVLASNNFQTLGSNVNYKVAASASFNSCPTYRCGVDVGTCWLKHRLPELGSCCSNISCPVCPPIRIPDGNLILDVKASTQATARCRTGFQLQGLSIANCVGRNWTFPSSPPSCEDVNECTLTLHNCSDSQQCINAPGTFQCHGTESSRSVAWYKRLYVVLVLSIGGGLFFCIMACSSVLVCRKRRLMTEAKRERASSWIPTLNFNAQRSSGIADGWEDMETMMQTPFSSKDSPLASPMQNSHTVLTPLDEADAGLDGPDIHSFIALGKSVADTPRSTFLDEDCVLAPSSSQIQQDPGEALMTVKWKRRFTTSSSPGNAFVAARNARLSDRVTGSPSDVTGKNAVGSNHWALSNDVDVDGFGAHALRCESKIRGICPADVPAGCHRDDSDAVGYDDDTEEAGYTVINPVQVVGGNVFVASDSRYGYDNEEYKSPDANHRFEAATFFAPDDSIGMVRRSAYASWKRCIDIIKETPVKLYDDPSELGSEDSEIVGRYSYASMATVMKDRPELGGRQPPQYPSAAEKRGNGRDFESSASDTGQGHQNADHSQTHCGRQTDRKGRDTNYSTPAITKKKRMKSVTWEEETGIQKMPVPPSPASPKTTTGMTKRLQHVSSIAQSPTESLEHMADGDAELKYVFIRAKALGADI